MVEVPDVTKWPGYVPGDEQIRSEIALPLIVDDELQGVLDVESTEPDAFSGTIAEVLAGPEHDYWTVQGAGRTWLLPAVAAIVERVDLTGRRVTVRPPEGLVELDA